MVELLIHTQNNNIEERKYAIDMLMGTFLGLNYQIVFDDNEDYLLDFSNKKIIIKDAFFSSFRGALSYLTIEHLPNISFVKSLFSLENDVVAIFGKDPVVAAENEIYCGIDLFASTFFMLTRWEEYVSKRYDIHGRFIGKESIAYLNGFLNRPVVNEYCEMLWNMLSNLGFDGNRKEREFRIVPTHDIDHFGMDHRFIKTIKSVASDILKKSDFSSAIHRLKWFVSDPYDNMCQLATISERAGLQSHFYMMSANPSIIMRVDSKWIFRRKFTRRVHDLLVRGHLVGFHPGYFTFDDEDQLQKEKSLLENSIGVRINEGRHHYLRVSLPDSLLALEKVGMKIDSSLGYADVEGFRCGTGDEFPYFDFLNRRQTNLIERPLVIMDGTLIGYQKYDMNKIREVLNYYKDICNKYKMTMNILFHNSVFADKKGNDLLKIYKNFLTKE